MRPHHHLVRQDLLTGNLASFLHLTEWVGLSVLYFRDTSQGPGGSQASAGLPHGTSSPTWYLMSWHPRPGHVVSDTAAGVPRAAGVSAGGSAGAGCRSVGAGCLGEKVGADGGILLGLYSTLNLRASSIPSTAPLLLRVPHALLRSLHGFSLSRPSSHFTENHKPQHARPPFLPSVTSSPAHEPFLGSPGTLLKWLFPRSTRSAMALLLNPMALLCI